MEFGFLLGRAGTGATLDGTNNNAIRNSTITLQRAYTSTTNNTPYGIFATAGTVAVPFTALSPTSATAAGQSSNNTFAGNTIQNVNGGIFLQGLADVSPYTNFDQGNTVGGSSAAGNTIQNYGGAATAAYGIRLQYQNNAVASGNTLANSAAGGVAGASTLYGIYNQSGTNLTSTFNRNTITLAQAANGSQVAGIYNATGGTGVLTIDGNTLSMTATASTGTFYSGYNGGSYSTTTGTVFSFSNNTISYTATGAATNTFYALYNSGTISGTSNFNNNQFLNAANPVASTGTLGFIYNTNSSTGPINLQNNQWTLNRTGASGSVYGYYNGSSPTGAHTFTGNNFSNITVAGSSDFYGLYVLTSASQPQTVTGNTLTNITGGSGTTAPLYIAYGAAGSTVSGNTATGISAAGTVYGLYTGSSFAGTVSGNTVGNISSSGTSSAVNGMRLSTSGTLNVFTNKVYGVASSGATGTAAGIYVASSGTYSLYNNLVGGITAPASSSSIATAGFYLNSGTTITAYYNTIYLAGTSSASGFGSAGIYASTTPALTLIDNIVVNASVATGTGVVAAYRRSSTTLTTYAAASNNNLLYAGAPGTTQAIFTDGTNTYPTLAAYKTAMATRDQASVTELPTFASTTGTDATFLHFAAGANTQAESGGIPVAGITTDYDGDTRNATTPDIGADEGTFAPAVPIVVASTTYTQNNTPTAAGQNDQQVTGVVVNTTGQINAPTLTSITFSPGSTSLSNISNAKLYSSGSSTFSLASATLLATTGSLASPSFTLTLTTPLALTSGSNYFFLTYDIPLAATAGATVAATATAVSVGGTTYTPTLSGAAGGRTIVGPLVGTYYITGTVGSSPDPTKEFASLTAAFAAYSSRSLGGAVSFVLRDASYSTAETFPLVLNANSTASATNTLTIRPDAGVTPTISGSVATGAVLKINGADYVTIDGSNAGTTSQNLTITNTSATGSGNAVLWIAAASANDGATFNTVKNTNITGNSAASFPQFAVFLGGGGIGVAAPTTSTPIANSNNTLSNNLITRGFYGVFVFGVSATSLDQGNTIAGNQIGQTAANTGFGQEGLRAVYQQGLALTGNDIQNVASGTATANIYGIYLADCKGAVVSRNAVHGISYSGSSTYKVWAINSSTTTFNTAANASANRFDNNLVYAINSTTASSTWNTVGINCGGGYGDQYYYNTVYLSGQLSAATGTAGSAAFANGNPSVTTTSTNLDVRNNIFSIVGGTGGTASTPLYANYTYGTNYTGSTLNYNDLYVTAGATGLPVIAHLTTSTSPTGDYATLAAWQTATSQEANSVSADPQFAQTTTVPYNLTPSNVALNNAATPISGLTTDYTGATRGTLPDIGAIEFTPLTNDLAPVALVAPAATSTCYGTAEAVSVSIRNAGTAPLSFATNAATITVVVTLPGGTTQTLIATVNTGTLASNATQTVTLPTTLNMSAVGTYSFAITATVVGDGNTTNDVLTPAATRTVVAPVAGTLAPAASSICVSGTATLTLTGAANGNLQWQSSSSATGTFTDVAGATSATFTTPVLTSTTYYRVAVGCNTNVVYSSVSAITVNNPLVATTNTPISICAGSTATLTATASAGSSVRFFSAATGGTALATGGSYTTPALTANTTYYAEAFAGGVEPVGKPSTNGADGSNTVGGLYFTTTGPTTITTVTVYQTATATAGTATIQLLSGSTTTGTALQQQVVTLPANTTGAVLAIPVTLNFAVPAAGSYTLYLSASTTALVRDYTSAALPATAYPYTSASGTVRITDGTLAGYYYFFYNWQLSSECAGATRTPIQVNVTPPATATFSYPATGGNCAGSTSTVAPTLTTGATAGTFTLPTATGLSINAATGAVTIGATAVAGTYTVTNTVAASGSCGPVTATAPFTVNPTPARPTLTATYNGTVTTLTSSAATGNQFYFNGVLIAGATGQTYVVNGSPTTYGPYTVVVTNSFGCASPASVATVVTTTRAGIAGASLLVYPNPTPTGQLTLELSGFRSTTQLAVLDALGRVVRAETLPATTGVVRHALDLSGLAPGVYLLRLSNADGVETRRLVRE